MMMWFIMAPGFIVVSSLVWMLLTGAELHAILPFAIALCVILFVAILYRPTRWYAAALTIILPAALAFALHPVCVPMDTETVRLMSPPIESRVDRDIYMDVFQKQPDGSWDQCKTQLSRWMFF